jgi:hypothetical protein
VIAEYEKLEIEFVVNATTEKQSRIHYQYQDGRDYIFRGIQQKQQGINYIN